MKSTTVTQLVIDALDDIKAQDIKALDMQTNAYNIEVQTM